VVFPFRVCSSCSNLCSFSCSWFSWYWLWYSSCVHVSKNLFHVHDPCDLICNDHFFWFSVIILFVCSCLLSSSCSFVLVCAPCYVHVHASFVNLSFLVHLINHKKDVATLPCCIYSNCSFFYLILNFWSNFIPLYLNGWDYKHAWTLQCKWSPTSLTITTTQVYINFILTY